MKHTKEVTRLGLFIALAVGLGYALILLPNVELMTLTVFLSGYFLGRWKGVLVGAVAIFLFSLFNPLGVPFPPVLIAQVVCLAMVGLVGGLSQRWVKNIFSPTIMGLALLGCLLTLLYDLGTTLGLVISMGLLSRFWVILLTGGIFSIIHIISNIAFFTVLAPPLIKIMEGKEVK